MEIKHYSKCPKNAKNNVFLTVPISLTAYVPNLKVQEHFFQLRINSKNQVTHVSFCKTYTAKTVLIFLEEYFYAV